MVGFSSFQIPQYPDVIEEIDLMDFIPALFVNAPVREDDVLTIKSDVFSTSSMSLLFTAFSLYFN
jgi:CxxC motif-containing protein